MIEASSPLRRRDPAAPSPLGAPPAPGADRIREVFAPEVERGELLVLDGGVLGNVPPSTLVDCTSPVPRRSRSPEPAWCTA